MALKGFFVIKHISGYTEHLTRSKLDHVNEILQSLFDAQIAAVKHPSSSRAFEGMRYTCLKFMETEIASGKARTR
jgi:hypothetical protein